MADTRNPRPAGKPGADGFRFCYGENSCKEIWGIFFLVWGGYRISTGYKYTAVTPWQSSFCCKKNSVCVCVSHLQPGFFKWVLWGGTRWTWELRGWSWRSLDVVTLVFFVGWRLVRFVTSSDENSQIWELFWSSKCDFCAKKSYKTYEPRRWNKPCETWGKKIRGDQGFHYPGFHP